MRQIFANYLAAPFVAGALFFLYLAWSADSDYARWIIPFVVLTALIYTFAPQINWWWYRRHPLPLPFALRQLLERFCVFYRSLDSFEQQRFRDRAGLFIIGTEWTPMAWPEETVPPDVQLALAAQAVTLTFHRPEFLFAQFEKVVVYPYPFPSPEYDFVHASELYEPDGCLLFSAEQLLHGFVQPGMFYNIGLHEYAKAFILSYPTEPYPDFSGSAEWAGLQAISQMSREHIESVIGLAGVEALPVAIHHYFVFPEKFRAGLPERAAAFDRIFSRPEDAIFQSSLGNETA
ncbi:MAG: zinc-dependent peptidase [Saprospirales bacterium]|nr:zinc-dependent peptidase [Saprospirales bacterium]